MLHNFKKTLLFVGGSALLFIGAGCGDDPAVTADAAVTTDATTAVDATVTDSGVPTEFSATLAAAEVTVTNPAAAMFAVGGAVMNIGFTAPGDVTVAPQPGYTNNIGACRIFVYDVAAGESAPTGSDGGPVTVSGTNAGEFVCNYVAAIDDYVCSSTAAEASGVTVAAGTSATPILDMMSNPTGTVSVVLGSVDLGTFDPTGGAISLTGFVDPAMNGTFAVLGKPGINNIVILNPALAMLSASADGTYSTLVGTGPIPGGYEFLDDGTNDVSFAKDGITDAPAIATTLKTNGQGFALDARSALPHAMPTDGSAVTFTCDSDDMAGNDNDTCGVEGENPLKGLIIFGETTDAPLPKSPAAFNVMPDPVSSYATFQCSGIGAKEISLDMGAMALLLGTNPTRIQTSVVYASAALAGPNNLLVSHGVVGFTDVPPAQQP